MEVNGVLAVTLMAFAELEMAFAMRALASPETAFIHLGQMGPKLFHGKLEIPQMELAEDLTGIHAMLSMEIVATRTVCVARFLQIAGLGGK